MSFGQDLSEDLLFAALNQSGLAANNNVESLNSLSDPLSELLNGSNDGGNSEPTTQASDPLASLLGIGNTVSGQNTAVKDSLESLLENSGVEKTTSVAPVETTQHLAKLVSTVTHLTVQNAAFPQANLVKNNVVVSNQPPVAVSSTISFNTGSSSSATQQNSATSGSKQNTYARVTVGGRKFLIPVNKKNGAVQKIFLPSLKKTITINPPGAVTKETVTAAPKVAPITLAQKSPVANVKPVTQTSALNLGSLFVESAVKAELSPSPSPTIQVPLQPSNVSLPARTYTVSPVVRTPTDNRASPLLLPSVTYFQNIAKDIMASTAISNQVARPIPKTVPPSPNFSKTIISGNSALLGKRSRSPVFSVRGKLPAQTQNVVFTGSSTSVKNFHQKRPDSPLIKLPKVSLSQEFQEDEGYALEDVSDGESEKNVVDTFSEYKPEKITFGLPHPDCVVETSALSSISLPDVHYRLSIPDQTLSQGWLSALQLETITYACQKHLSHLPSGERSGFLIGDGAGVGKGRTIAGIIYENYLLGRKRALWFSVSNDLKYDSERDLRDIGAKNIKVHTISKFKYGKISSRENSSVKKGVLFVTYSMLISESHTDSKYGSRLKQILQWCGKEFDGVIVFDECHRAKNLVPTGSTKATKTGFAVMELQRKLPNARIIYASATGASEPRNMAYMSRLGLWGIGTQFPKFGDFIQAIERRGVGAMELVAMDLKCRGAYIARQLSFSGVTFWIEEVKLDDGFEKIYNSAVELWIAAREAFQVASDLFDVGHQMKKTMWGQFWAAHQRFFKYLCIGAKVRRTSEIARQAVKHGKCVVIGLQSTGEARTLDQLERCGGELDDFVSTARGVLQNLVEQHFPAPDRKRVTALFGEGFYDLDINKNSNKKKVSNVRKAAESDDVTESGNAESSSESDVDSIDYSDEDIGKIFGGDDSDSEDWGGESSVKKRKKNSATNKKSQEKAKPDPEPVVTISNHTATITSIKSDISDTSGHVLSSLRLQGCDPMVKVQKIKQELLEKLESLDLPNNALDDLIDALGGPENVAEMTGRKGRVVLSESGEIQYQSRSENEVGAMLNISEKQRFMDGEKNIAIISEAASSGISLQSDRRARNQRRRMHITLELPWSADRAIQQFGRTHRSNQVNAPEYVFLITELAGERRFASVVAKRLESLGALTHGDRRATATRGLSQFNFDNKYGRLALDAVMKSFINVASPLVKPPHYDGNFFTDIRRSMIGVGLVSKNLSTASFQVEKEGCSIAKFLNRILGIDVVQQNALFQYFSDTLSTIVHNAKIKGQYDQGIKDFGSAQGIVECTNSTSFRINSSGIESYVELRTVKVDKGLSWKDADSLWLKGCNGIDDGFYASRGEYSGNRTVALCIESGANTKSAADKGKDSTEDRRLFVIHKPNTGKQVRKESFGTIGLRYKKIEAHEAEMLWKKHYEASLKQCYHSYWRGTCAHIARCTVGKRQHTYHILSGSVLAIWKIIEHVLSMANSAPFRMQIVSFVSKTEGQLVGLLIPANCICTLKSFLENPTVNGVQVETSSVSKPLLKSSNSDFLKIDFSNYQDPEDDFSPDEFESSVLAPLKQTW